MTPEPAPSAWDAAPGFPTETEIYILPDGQVVIADLPAELASHLAALLRPPTAPQSTPTDHDTDQ